MYKYKCKLCKDVGFDNYTSLSRHIGRTHHVSTGQFYVDYYLNGECPTCKCGCGEKLKYSYNLKGFTDYCKGHIARIKNNWGHNSKAIEKSAETRRRQYASGERIQWNKGLTVDDPRVKLNTSASTSAINSNPEELKRRSDLMKEISHNGVLIRLSGMEHPNWKGGISNIYPIVYADRRLYKEWKYPILIRDGFKCTKCGSSYKLHIHHDIEYMTEIIKNHMVDVTEEMLKDFEIKKMISDAVVDYHINNKVSGITLCGNCHNNLHPSLNFR